MIQAPKPTQPRIRGLDGLRGYAVILVLISHITMNTFPGYVGVDVFFVLSGFLITNLLRIEFAQTSSINYGRFLKRRFIRLYPSLIIAIILAALCARLLGGISQQFVADAAVAALYLEPWFITFANWDGGMFRHTWSLGLEEFFYLLWPLLFLATMKFSVNRKTWILVLGLSMLLIPVIVSFISYSPNPLTDYILRIGGIFLGCSLSFAKFQVSKKWTQIIFIFGIAGIVTSMLTTQPGLGSLLAAGSTCAVIASFSRSVGGPRRSFAWIVENSLVTWFGKISYELYLVHYIFIVSTIWYLAGQSFSNTEIRNVLPTVGVISIGIAYFVYLVQAKIRDLLTAGLNRSS